MYKFANRWRAKVLLLRIPVRDRPEVQLKAIAYGALDGRRKNWGYQRKWAGNYLTQQVWTVSSIGTTLNALIMEVSSFQRVLCYVQASMELS